MSSPDEFADTLAPSEPEASSFGPPFWFTYASNLTQMVAVSLLFVYNDFLKLLGGTEFELGLIVGLGMVGSIIMRFVQGVGIDRFGARRIWLASTSLFIVSCLGNLLVRDIDSPAVYMLRILYQSSVAGIFSASITFVSGRAAVARMAEVVGTLGTSGFIGMMAGTAIGGMIVGDESADRAEINHLFLTAALFASLAFTFAWFATRGTVAPVKRRRGPPLWWLLRRYNPGLILLMSIATGLGLNLPTVFLRPYVEHYHLDGGLVMFFNTYPPIAFIMRLTLRRVPDRLGIRPMLAIGIVSLVIGLLALVPVRETWQLIFAAFFMGLAHACLFPAVVAGGSGAFPGRYRGSGTTLVLAMFDIGTFVGAPLAGAIIRLTESYGWPSYGTLLPVLSALLAASGIVYFAFSKSTYERRT